MLLQWVIAMGLSALISLGAVQGYMLLTEMHRVQVALSQEQAQIRFLVGYFRALFLLALKPHEICGEGGNDAKVITPVKKQGDSILSLQTCRLVRGDYSTVPMQFYVAKSELTPGLTLFVKEGDHRLEALSSQLRSFSVRLCVLKGKDAGCQSSEKIQDLSAVEGVDFNLEFVADPSIDRMVTLQNQHRWHFFLKIGRAV